jgi:hypothetical protein
MTSRNSLYAALSLAGITLMDAPAPIVLRPNSHDFGKAVVRGFNNHLFKATVPGGINNARTISASISGANAADFYVIDPMPGMTYYCINPGVCDIEVWFSPKSIGKKFAVLNVLDALGNGGVAMLSGEGIVAPCKPVIVPCNYMHLYDGQINILSRDSSYTASHRRLDVTDLTIKVANGVATCVGTASEWEQNGVAPSALDLTTQGNGLIGGPGLVAIEFEEDQQTRAQLRAGARPTFHYTIRFACPTAAMNSTTTNHRSGDVISNQSPADSAEWRDEGLGFDQQPADSVGMAVLSGKQTDVRHANADGVDGITRMSWNLRRVR